MNAFDGWVKIILAVTVFLSIVVPTISNSLRGNILSDVSATSVATLLGAIVTGLFFLKKPKDQKGDEEHCGEVDEEDKDDDDC